MKIQLLPPCMQYRNDAWCSPHILLVLTQCDQSLRSTGEKEIVQKFLVFIYEVIEFMRNCEDDVVIGDPFDQFGLTLHDPLFLQGSLAAWTVTVVAGNRVDLCVPAFFTIADVITE